MKVTKYDLDRFIELYIGANEDERRLLEKVAIILDIPLSLLKFG